jgi:hypothetical protein
MHSKNRKAFHFHQLAFTHGHLTLAQSIDDEVKQFVRTWVNSEDVRNNTFVVIMADHGARTHVSSLLQPDALVASLDQKNPFVYLLVPPWVKEKYPERIKALMTNAKERMTTNIDLYHTIVHLFLMFDKDDVRNHRGQTLFNVIPKNRTCDDVGIIRKSLCGCRKIVSLDPRYLRHNNAFQKHIKTFKGICPLLLKPQQ